MSAGFRSVNSEDSSLGLVNFSSQYDSKICPRECVTKTEKMSNISMRKISPMIRLLSLNEKVMKNIKKRLQLAANGS